ncbi:hypothetical protein SAMN02745857_02515 [Andreprevotia lacus DSM 23236]|jgi:uncharacterized protein (TIRG00374 family)|uniref:Lysylphosphatidylglycerol synthase TM region n=1 Tax=Andreprevotia lacus DSM 23236 TaxID=1121001 RepID=A0A1W1XRM8_9NEIS|nr:lysylphosphatidylglycerol synthase transmembrane domain-containing protein [Andreprevotia lacus]SMC26524.1 hypothetical protein SAMN02745857_02515 [Andreprevotia lacus DSM 23236]
MKNKKSWLRLIIGAVLAALFCWLIARNLDWHELGNTLAQARPGWIAAALLAFTVGYACRISRWHTMLQHDAPQLTRLACAGPFLASFAANNVLPFRAGDVMRAFAFNRRLGTTSGTVLATLFVERLLDLLMVIVMLGGALLAFQLNAATFARFGVGFLFAAALIILVALLFPQAFAPLVRLGVKLVSRFAPAVGARLQQEADKGLGTLAQLAKGATMLKLLGWSLAAWLAEGTLFYCAALALPAVVTPILGWLALPVGTLATLIPSTPGYVGTFDFPVRLAMTVWHTNSVEAATAFALLVHALLWLPPTIAGGLYLITHRSPKSNAELQTDPQS